MVEAAESQPEGRMIKDMNQQGGLLCCDPPPAVLRRRKAAVPAPSRSNPCAVRQTAAV